MNSSSLDLSAVVLDVDRTLIRSVRSSSSINPYPHYKSQHVEEYFHFSLNRAPKRRSNSLSLSSSISSSSSTTSNTQQSASIITPPSPSLSSSKSSSSQSTSNPSKPPTPDTIPSLKFFKSSSHTANNNAMYCEHYHIYIRPGLKKLMTYLHYLQQHTNVKMVIASMAKRDYIDRILKGLKKHCTERKFPKFESVLTRESWDENLSPSSTPTYPISVLLDQIKKHGLTKRINLRYKSIDKICRILCIEKGTNLLIVDDDLGYYDHDDRVSGQIYQIPAWNGPICTQRNVVMNVNEISLHAVNDSELASLGAMIQAIVDKGSIQKYLFSRVLSVFRHQYGNKHNKQMKVRKRMINILMNDIGMVLDEDTAISSLWIFDNILKCCKLSNDDWMTSIGEYIEILFGCIIVYQMYIYDVHPSAHFYKLSFTQNEFWKQVMDVYFEYYVGLLLHIKDQRLHSSNKKKTKMTKRASQFVQKYMNLNNLSKGEMKEINDSSSNMSKSKNKKQRSSIKHNLTHKSMNTHHFNDYNHIAPIEVAQSESQTTTKCEDIEATEEVIIKCPKPQNIVLNQQQYKSIQDNLKVLVKSISTSIFCKNLSPVCFIGYSLLRASRTNPVPKCISKYKKILKKVYRDRNK